MSNPQERSASAESNPEHERNGSGAHNSKSQADGQGADVRHAPVSQSGVSHTGQTREGGARDVDSLGAIPGAIADAVAEDPLLSFLDRKIGLFSQWRRNLLILAVIAAGFYFKARFDQNFAASQARATAILADLRAGYSTFEPTYAPSPESTATQESSATQGEEGEADDGGEVTGGEGSATEAVLTEDSSQTVTRLREYIRALETEREPFRSYAKIYDALLALKLGEEERARATVEALKMEFSELRGEGDSWEAFAAQAVRYLSARVALLGESISDDDRTAARAELELLVKEGSYFAGPAFSLLTAAFPHLDFSELKAQLLARYPELVSIVEGQ